MPAYVIAEVAVTNPTGYETYRPLAAASVARHGGRFVVRGGSSQRLEGDPPAGRIVVIEFADAAAARRWYNSSDYQEALKVRLANSTGRVMIVEGA